MLILQTPNKYRVLIDSHGERDGSRQDHLEQLKAEYATEDGGFKASISDCDQVGSHRERSSSICNCHNDCHGGWTVDIDEIVLVREDVYEKLREVVEAEEGREPGMPLSGILNLGY